MHSTCYTIINQLKFPEIREQIIWILEKSQVETIQILPVKHTVLKTDIWKDKRLHIKQLNKKKVTHE